jgi:hypothetical protein
MSHKYLYRPQGVYAEGSRPASPYHFIAEGKNVSKCGAAIDGQQGFQIVEKEKPLLTARICHNCLINRVIRPYSKE